MVQRRLWPPYGAVTLPALSARRLRGISGFAPGGGLTTRTDEGGNGARRCKDPPLEGPGRTADVGFRPMAACRLWMPCPAASPFARRPCRRERRFLPCSSKLPPSRSFRCRRQGKLRRSFDPLQAGSIKSEANLSRRNSAVVSHLR